MQRKMSLYVKQHKQKCDDDDDNVLIIDLLYLKYMFIYVYYLIVIGYSYPNKSSPHCLQDVHESHLKMQLHTVFVVF